MRRTNRNCSILVVAAFIVGWPSFLRSEPAEPKVLTPEYQEYVYRLYATGPGGDREMLSKLPKDALRRLIVLFRSDGIKKGFRMDVLYSAMTDGPFPASDKSDAKAAIYETLRDPMPHNRHAAIRYVALMDKAAASRPLLGMLNDPDRSVRIMALVSLRDHAPKEFAAEIEQICADRQKSLLAAGQRDDEFFEIAGKAISKIKSRDTGKE